MIVIARVGLVVLGFSVGLLAVEALLRLGAAGVRITGDDSLPVLLEGPVRVVCLGDSNTYGFYVSRAEAWPQQLETFLMADPDRRPVQVINLGYPGMNSSRMRNVLPRILETLHPDLVMLMAGSNDFWTVPDPIREHRADAFEVLAWRYFRVYRLLHMVTRASRVEVIASGNIDAWRGPDDVPRDDLDEGVGVVRGEGLELPLGWKRADKAVGDWDERLDDNLTTMARFIRNENTKVAFVTYPENQRGIYALANDRLRAAAQATDTPLIDVGAKFDALCSESCAEFFFSDLHPTARGYTRVARELAEELRRQPHLLAR